MAAQVGNEVAHARTAEEKTAIAESFMSTDFAFSEDERRMLRTPGFCFWNYATDPVNLLGLLELMFEELNLLATFSVPRDNFRRFLCAVFVAYKDNPYHNFNHCFCVTQMLYCAITGFSDSWLTDLETFVLLSAAICHDLDHPGTNNAYQKKAHTWFVDKYPDSFLERYHWDIAQSILSKPESDIFVALAPEERKEAFALMERLILATDMALHQQFVQEFKDLLANGSYSAQDPHHRVLVMLLMLKACDISNEARPLAATDRWVGCLLDEFFHQGDIERSQGLQVDQLMDRSQVEKNSSQVGFIQFVSLPLFQELGRVVPLQPMLENLRRNLNHYEQEKTKLNSKD